MEAGYGAEEQATRRSQKVERLRRERDADASTRSAVEAELERVQKQQRAWSAGAEGERLVAATLATLAPYGWTALHDLHWPGRPLANIDHIAIGPGGVIVIDAKNWTGSVTVQDGALRQNGYRRDREVEGVLHATAAVAGIFRPEHRDKVRGVLCLVGQEQEPVQSAQGVTLLGRLQLPSLLVGLPPLLTPYDVADIGRRLHDVLGVAGSPKSSRRRRTGGRGADTRRVSRRRELARALAVPLAMILISMLILQSCLSQLG